MTQSDKCQTCGHNCIAHVVAKCGDLFHFRWPGGREQGGYVLPHETIGLRDNGAYHDYVSFQYCLVCGQIQGKWPVKGADKYLREFAPKRLWEAIVINDGGYWSGYYFKSTTKEKIEYELRTNDEFRKSISFEIHETDDVPENVVVRDLG
jgi:hypothetical protein